MGFLGWFQRFARQNVAVPHPAVDVLGAASLPHDSVAIPPVPKMHDASARFARCVAEVLRHEGGFVHDPRDRGGATNRGITQASLADWRGRAVTVDEVRQLTESEAREIYRARYWNAVQGDALPPGVDLAVFDLAVNSGAGRAARMLQHALGVSADGAIGPQTLAAVRRASPPRLAGDLCRARLAWLRGLDGWGAFGRGWERRVADVQGAALGMTR